MLFENTYNLIHHKHVSLDRVHREKGMIGLANGLTHDETVICFLRLL